MPRATLVQTNFTAGELSPRVLGRVDVERYKNGAEEMYNVLPLIHGGAKSTPTLRYNGEAKNADRKCRLIRFEFSKTEANMLEFGHEYMRVWNQDRTQVMSGGSPYEITTVYQEGELFDIEYVGGADTIFLFHENHPVQRLRRFTNDTWVIDEAPFDPAPFAEQGHNLAVGLTLSDASAGTGRTFTADATVFLNGDVGRRITYGGGIALITGLSSGTEVTCTIETPFPSTSIASGTWTLNGSPMAICTPSAAEKVGDEITLNLGTGNGFRNEDVGSYVAINSGLVKINGYTSSSEVSAIILQELSSATYAQKGAWILKQSIWNDDNGYPRTGTFFQQRLAVGGSPAYPHTVAFSRIGEYLNFELGLNDDDAFMYTLDATEFNPILHLAKAKNRVIALTAGNEFTLTGGVEAPITPTNTQVDSPTDYGCSNVRPVRVGNELIFFNRTRRKLRAMGYRFENDSFSSPDLTKLSEHITGDGIVDMAYQQEPESIIWCVREDGVLVTMTIDRDEGVLAWSRQLTNDRESDVFESVEVIPNDDGLDEAWVVVNRTVNGSQVRYIESFDMSAEYGLHSAISATDSTGKTTWGGLDHLEGETVEVVADGVIMGADFVVSSGEITIDRDANEVYIGLPARGYIKTLNPEVVTQMGSAQGNNIRIANITLRMLDSRGAKIDGQYADARKMGNVLNEGAPTFTGDIDVSSLGWKRNGFVTIEQANALPFHVLAVIIKVTVNG